MNEESNSFGLEKATLAGAEVSRPHGFGADRFYRQCRSCGYPWAFHQVHSLACGTFRWIEVEDLAEAALLSERRRLYREIQDRSPRFSDPPPLTGSLSSQVRKLRWRLRLRKVFGR